MSMWRRPWLAIALSSLVAGTPAFADNLLMPLQDSPQSSIRPMADEKCIEKCDVDSDECMQDAGGDSGKSRSATTSTANACRQCEGG